MPSETSYRARGILDLQGCVAGQFPDEVHHELLGRGLLPGLPLPNLNRPHVGLVATRSVWRSQEKAGALGMVPPR